MSRKSPPPTDPAKGGLVASWETFRDAVFDPKGKWLYTAVDGGVERYSYPDLQRYGGYRLGRTFRHLGLDAERQRIHVVHCTGYEKTTDGRERGKAAELTTFDVSDLKPNGLRVFSDRKSAPLPVEGRLKLEGVMAAATWSADGKTLYYVDWAGKKLFAIDASARKVAGSAATEEGPSAVCLTPDGKTIWVACVKEPSKGKLQRFDTVGLVRTASHDLDFLPLEVRATDDGKVCVAGRRARAGMVALLDAGKGFRVVHRSDTTSLQYLDLSADRSHFYLCQRHKDREVGGITLRRLSAKKEDPRMEDVLTTAVLGFGIPSGGRGLIACPNGEYVVLPPFQAVLRLPKE